jgi:hypothetical protein
MGRIIARIRAWLLVDSFFTTIARLTLFFVTVGMIVWFLGSVTGTLINRPPDDGKEAVEKLTIPAEYRLRTESQRAFQLDDRQYIISRLAFADVDRNRGKYILDLKGYNTGQQRIYYDGKRILEEPSSGDNRILEKGPSMAEVAGATKKELARMDPRLITNDATYQGTNKQAWIIEFKPTCKDLRRWMMWDGLREYTDSYLPASEYKALEDEKCEVEWAYLFIDHKTHYPLMMDVFFTVGDGVSYRYLIKYSGFNHGRLEGLEIDRSQQ